MLTCCQLYCECRDRVGSVPLRVILPKKQATWVIFPSCFVTSFMNVPYLYNFNISKFLCFRKIQQKTLFSYLYWTKNWQFKILRQLIREKIPEDFFRDQLTPSSRYHVRRSIDIRSNSIQFGVVRLICVISTLARWHMLDLECLNRKKCVCVCKYAGEGVDERNAKRSY